MNYYLGTVAKRIEKNIRLGDFHFPRDVIYMHVDLLWALRKLVKPALSLRGCLWSKHRSGLESRTWFPQNVDRLEEKFSSRTRLSAEFHNAAGHLLPTSPASRVRY